VELISAVSRSPLFGSLLSDLHDHNVGTHMIISDPSMDNSIYLDIIDERGVVIGASDTKLAEKIKKEDLIEAMMLITKDDVVIVDTNLPHDVIKYILTHSKGYNCMDAVSSKKLEKVLDLLECVDLLKVNEYEYAVAKDYLINDYIITKGNGATVHIGEFNYSFTHDTVSPVNPTGCGDTFFATFIVNMKKGIKEALIEAVRAATASALSLNAVPEMEEIKKIDVSKLNIVWREND